MSQSEGPATLAPGPAPVVAGGARAERAVMAVAMVSLAFLVVLPLAFLGWGSLSEEGRPTLEHFREALSNRLYVTALRNSLVLGTWTALLSLSLIHISEPTRLLSISYAVFC